MNEPYITNAIENRIALLPTSITLRGDHAYIMGMIEMAEYGALIDEAVAEVYRDWLDEKFLELDNQYEDI